MSQVAQAIETVRKAVTRFKKKPLADRAGLSDYILRDVHSDNFNPQADTLRKLEDAAADLEREHGPAPRAGQRESKAGNPGKAARA